MSEEEENTLARKNKRASLKEKEGPYSADKSGEKAATKKGF